MTTMPTGAAVASSQSLAWQARHRRVATGLLGILCLLLTVLLLTDQVLPALASRCGRLVQIPAGPESLSMNHSRLDLPAGAAWRDIALEYRLEPNEALSFVVQRAGPTLLTVRISRHPDLAEGLAVYRDGALESLQPLAAGAAAGILEFHRDEHGLRVVRDGVVWATASGADVRNGSAFEVVLQPPDSTELHRRITLGEVRLDDGRTLGPRLLARLRSSKFLVLSLAVLLLIAVRRRLAGVLRALYPLQWAERPRDLVWLLACVNIPFAALLALPYGERIPAFQVPMRILFICIVLLTVVASLGFGCLRDQLLQRSSGARGSRLSHPVLILPTFILYTAVWFTTFVYSYTALVIARPRLHIDMAKTARGTRVACVGGSVTRGFPFPENGPTPPFPDLLESRLRSDGRPDAAVFNLGIDSAGIAYIAAHLRATIDTFHPTDLVVTSVVNDFFRSPDAYRADVERIVSEAQRGNVSRVLLVKEIEQPAVYGPGRSHGNLYDALDTVAAAHGITVIDPEPDFIAHRNEFLFMDWVHFTPRGNALMAEILARQF